jgi:predicted DNA-binding helix-hairpin-helix protein
MAWRLFARVCLVRGMLCVMPCLGFATKLPPAAPVNLNTATSEELQLVPGIGPATADKILQMRKSYGAFKSLDDPRHWAEAARKNAQVLVPGQSEVAEQTRVGEQARNSVETRSRAKAFLCFGRPS